MPALTPLGFHVALFILVGRRVGLLDVLLELLDVRLDEDVGVTALVLAAVAREYPTSKFVKAPEEGGRRHKVPPVLLEAEVPVAVPADGEGVAPGGADQPELVAPAPDVHPRRRKGASTPLELRTRRPVRLGFEDRIGAIFAVRGPPKLLQQLLGGRVGDRLPNVASLLDGLGRHQDDLLLDVLLLLLQLRGLHSLVDEVLPGLRAHRRLREIHSPRRR